MTKQPRTAPVPPVAPLPRRLLALMVPGQAYTTAQLVAALAIQKASAESTQEQREKHGQVIRYATKILRDSELIEQLPSVASPFSRTNPPQVRITERGVFARTQPPTPRKRQTRTTFSCNVIFDTIKKYGPIERFGLTDRSGISLSSAFIYTRELLAKGLIVRTVEKKVAYYHVPKPKRGAQ